MAFNLDLERWPPRSAANGRVSGRLETAADTAVDIPTSRQERVPWRSPWNARRTWRPRWGASSLAGRRLDRFRQREQFWLRARLEIEKARRHGRRFALALLRYDANPVRDDRIRVELTAGLRFEDAVLVDDRRPGEVLVMLSEIDAGTARHVLDRIETQHAAHRLRRVAMATFPVDALTLQALVDVLLGADTPPHRRVTTSARAGS